MRGVLLGGALVGLLVVFVWAATTDRKPTAMLALAGFAAIVVAIERGWTV